MNSSALDGYDEEVSPDIRGELCFSIRSEDDFEENIEEFLGLMPEKVVKKGEQLSLSMVAPKNAWIYQVKFSNYDDFASKSVIFFSQLICRQQEIDCLKIKYDVYIDIFVRCDLGQLGYTFPTEAVKMASQMGLDIEFHILSFGLAE